MREFRSVPDEVPGWFGPAGGSLASQHVSVVSDHSKDIPAPPIEVVSPWSQDFELPTTEVVQFPKRGLDESCITEATSEASGVGIVGACGEVVGDLVDPTGIRIVMTALDLTCNVLTDEPKRLDKLKDKKDD